MTYSGKYKVQNIDKYEGDYRNVTYRSNWERLCFAWCDNNPAIIKWSSEEVVIPYYYDVDRRYHKYYMDLKIKLSSGKVILVEIKPKKETEPPKKQGKTKQRYLTEATTFVKNKNKWAAALEYAKDRAWSFEVWTEDTLKSLGIMKTTTTSTAKKKIKPMKKLKPLRKPKKK